MGKRLRRIDKSAIPTNKEQLVNTELHIVLKDGAAYYGKINAWEKDSFTFNDLRNHKHHFLLTDVSEIIIDTLAAY